MSGFHESLLNWALSFLQRGGYQVLETSKRIPDGVAFLSNGEVSVVEVLTRPSRKQIRKKLDKYFQEPYAAQKVIFVVPEKDDDLIQEFEGASVEFISP